MSWRRRLERRFALAAPWRWRSRAARRAGLGAEPAAAEAERLLRRQRPRHDPGVRRIHRAGRQAPGAAGDLPPLGQQPQRRLRTLAGNRHPADPAHLDRRRPDPGGADHPGADRARRRRRLPAAAQLLLRQTRAARLHPAAGRAEPLPQRLVGGQLRRQPERRRTHHRLVQAGLPPDRRDRPRRPEPGRDQRDPGGNRPAAAEPDQRAESRQPAGGTGEHHLEPAAGRLAAREGQLPGQLLARQPLGRLGRHRLLLPVSGLGRPQPLLPGQAVEGQAGRDRRVGGLRRGRTRASSNS